MRFDDGFARAGYLAPGGGFVVLLDRPVHLRERQGRPDRTVALLDARGAARGRIAPTAGRELLDVGVHPSGELTVLEAADDGYHLLRYDGAGAKKDELGLVDPAILTDPPARGPGESTAPIEGATHDAGRMTVDGEEVLLATRTGRHSVIAYRVGREGGFVVKHRSLVIPAFSIYPVGLIGGSYDTFGQLDAHFGVHVARDAAGIVYVGVQHARVDTESVKQVLEAVFGDELETDPDGRDLFVTRLAPGGYRMGVTAVGTPEEDQLYGFRGGTDGALFAGRSETWNAQGTGHDALVGVVDRRGVASVRRLDLDRGDVAFDVLEIPGGRLAALGARGYTQNPSGASISEEASAFARVLGPLATEAPVATIELPTGPRHGQARFAIPLADGRLVIGGMLDGPGTHSADGDRALLRARGFLTVRVVP